MKISFQSDIGQKRQSNQDYVAVFTNEKGYKLALLADGMGGHLAGDIASRQTVEEIGKKWEKEALADSEKIGQWLIQCVQKENTTIFEHGQNNPEQIGMGTTLEAVAILDDQFTIAHVGDSRVYLLRDGELIQLTEDHSLVNELLKSGEITPEMASTHPRRNVITRSVGMPGTVEVDIISHSYLAEDQLLLCSDGLTNMVSPEEMTKILLANDEQEMALSQLIATANEHGGLDNITVLLIHFGGETHD